MKVHTEPVGPESREGFPAWLRMERWLKCEEEKMWEFGIPVSLSLCLPGLPLKNHFSPCPPVLICDMKTQINRTNLSPPSLRLSSDTHWRHRKHLEVQLEQWPSEQYFSPCGGIFTRIIIYHDDDLIMTNIFWDLIFQLGNQGPELQRDLCQTAERGRLRLEPSSHSQGVKSKSHMDSPPQNLQRAQLIVGPDPRWNSVS